MKNLRRILAQEGLVSSEISKQALSFKKGEDGVWEIGTSDWGINRSPFPPYEFQLLKLQMRAGGTWNIYSSADGENNFINGPLAKFYDFYYGEDLGPKKLAQDDHVIRTVLRKLH